MGPPLDICSLNIGTTDPEELSTLPNLTIENFVYEDLAELSFLFFSAYTCTIISANLFEAPIILVGLTALSVEIRTNLDIFNSFDTSHIA